MERGGGGERVNEGWKGPLGLCLRSTSPVSGEWSVFPWISDVGCGETQDAGQEGGYYGWPLPKGARFQLRRATAPPVHPRKSSPLERETGLYMCVYICICISVYTTPFLDNSLLFFLSPHLILSFFSLLRVSKTLRDATKWQSPYSSSLPHSSTSSQINAASYFPTSPPPLSLGFRL